MPKRIGRRSRNHKPRADAKGAGFWNKAYRKGDTLALSEAHSQDLETFLKWHSKQKNVFPFTAEDAVLDLGCGNGRNLFYVVDQFGCRASGFDSSQEAINQAKKRAALRTDKARFTFATRSIAGDIPLPDNSCTLVLDMMTSHFLPAAQREQLRCEIARVLAPDGWLFFKTFLLDGDLHAARLLKEHPADEPGSYLHPKIGKLEHVFTEQEIIDSYVPYFDIEKMVRSHKHRTKSGAALKRRSICLYARRN